MFYYMKCDGIECKELECDVMTGNRMEWHAMEHDDTKMEQNGMQMECEEIK